MNASWLAVDLGSTRFKVALFNEDFERVAEGFAPTPCRFGESGAVELPFKETEQALRAAVAQCRAAAGAVWNTLRGIGITSQAQTFALTDAGGRPRGDFISWRDTRGAVAPLQKITDWHEHAGFDQPSPGLTVSQLRRLLEGKRGVAAGARVAWLPSWLAHAWTGQWRFDANSAAMTGLYSLKTGAWWQAAVEAAGIDTAVLPDLAAPGEVAAATDARAADWGLPAGIPVVLAGNDQTAGAYGASLGERDALVTLGTALVVYRRAPVVPPSRPGTARGLYPGGGGYRLATDDAGGALIAWGRNLIAGAGDDPGFFALAEQAAPGCGGARFELSAADGKGRWSGLAAHHGAAELARSLVEALAGRVADLAGRVGGADKGAVFFAGGGARHSLWVELSAAALHRPARLSAGDPLAGAARMAARGVRDPSLERVA